MGILADLVMIANDDLPEVIGNAKIESEGKVSVPEYDSIQFTLRDLDGVKIVISDEKGPTQTTIDIKIIVGLWDNDQRKYVKTAEYANVRGITDRFDNYIDTLGTILAKKLSARGWKVKESAYHYFTAILSFIR